MGWRFSLILIKPIPKINPLDLIEQLNLGNYKKDNKKIFDSVLTPDDDEIYW